MAARKSSWLSIALLLLLTEAVYFRPSIWRVGLFGSDYRALHARHIAFARDGLLSPEHSIPGWYPRELLGAPFAANLQSFPWIPTRLLVLLLDARFTYAVAIAIAAALAALFTYLYCKRVGLSDLAAVSSGWTFACAGFFASRVMAGHLPMLEAYPALPLLLWLGDRAVAPDRAGFQRRDLFALALASACVALAGHPQLPAYALGAAVLYLIVRGRGRRRILAICSLALGIGLTLFAWWPMVLLIGRSTRVLQLAPPANDIAMPHGRLLALFLSGRDGFPEVMGIAGQKIFEGYPSTAYFWDTASYIGWLPLIAVVVLFFRNAAKKRMPGLPFTFLAVLGIGALLLSLPFALPVHRLVHGTLLRSPARLLYLSTFAASVALGCAVDRLLKGERGRRARMVIVMVCLAAHTVDLARFSHPFVQPAEQEGMPAAFTQILASELGDARIAADDPAYHEHYDDAGIFDSILLTSPYQALLRLAGLPPDLNEQRVDASEFPVPALQAAGVRFVIRSEDRDDLKLVRSTPVENLYQAPSPLPRATFVTNGRVEVPSAQLRYSRPSGDEIRVEATAPEPGSVEILESYDIGWSAAIDGTPSPVELENGFTIAVPIPVGHHSVLLRYRTPGRRLGYLLSLVSAALLAGLITSASKNKNPA